MKNHDENSTKTISTGRGLAMVVIGLMVLFGPVMVYNYHKNTSEMQEAAESTDESRTSVAHKTILDHLYENGYETASRHHRYEDRYWLIGDEGHETFILIAEAFQIRATRLLAEARGVSPLAREIVDEQGDFNMTMFFNGASMTIFLPGEGEDPLVVATERANKPEVVIVPAMQAAQYRHMFPGDLFYSKEWGAVIVVGIEMSDAWLAAFMVHEMGHQLRHKQGAYSATASSYSDEFIFEEMEMHEVEADILEHFSGGKLSELYEEIRQRADDPNDYHEAIFAVTPTDELRFEQIFGVDSTGPTLAGAYIAQFYLGLGIYTINQGGGGAVDKILLYREMTGQAQSMRHAAL